MLISWLAEHPSPQITSKPNASKLTLNCTAYLSLRNSN